MSYRRFLTDPISDHFVRLVDIIFGVIIAQGFVIYRHSIEAPTPSVGNLSLVLVYATVILSWVGYHRSVNAFPYNDTFVSKIRLFCDILILVLYSYLVFVAQDLSKVLVGLFLVCLLYVAAGIVRIVEWNDRKVSKLSFSSLLAAGFFTEWLVCPAGWLFGFVSPFVDRQTLSWFLVLLAIALMLIYRLARSRKGYPPIFLVGIDIDGVLGDQVSPVLSRIQQRKRIGIGLTKDEITEWNFPIDDSSISQEIEEALLDSEYAREMPVLPGSTTVLPRLAKAYHIVIASSRPIEAEAETKEWLKKNFPRGWHEYVNTRQLGKQTLRLKALVDDYPENIKSFVSESRSGLLFSQPWNQREDDDMKALIRSGKVVRCNDWREVETRLDDLTKRHPP